MAVGDIDLDESKADLSEEVEIEPGVRTLALTQGRNRTEAVAMARDVVCELLDTGDWGFGSSSRLIRPAHTTPASTPRWRGVMSKPGRGQRYRPDEAQLFDKMTRSLVQLRVNTLVVAGTAVGIEIADILAAQLDTGGQRVRRIDASGVTSAFALLAQAGEPDSTDIAADDWLELIRRLADTSHQHDQPQIVIVDQIPNPDIGFTLFGTMRDDLWEIHYRWAVFVPPGELHRYTTPPADTFFPTITHIDERDQ